MRESAGVLSDLLPWRTTVGPSILVYGCSAFAALIPASQYYVVPVIEPLDFFEAAVPTNVGTVDASGFWFMRHELPLPARLSVSAARGSASQPATNSPPAVRSTSGVAALIGNWSTTSYYGERVDRGTGAPVQTQYSGQWSTFRPDGTYSLHTRSRLR